MQEVFYNFFVTLHEQLIIPLCDAISEWLLNDSLFGNDDLNFYFNWFFNLGNDNKINYFGNNGTTGLTGSQFLVSIIQYFLIILFIILMVKLIKNIFKPIFKLLNIGSDIKWRR